MSAFVYERADAHPTKLGNLFVGSPLCQCIDLLCQCIASTCYAIILRSHSNLHPFASINLRSIKQWLSGEWAT
ncbi:hypothetical protein [Nostoc sp. 'Peltigera membranacea cyanobiont' N6]|uniref:hypothetical protein n=2 Tax=unclassified Nostoc TaxID=2593658 RepID=UPI0011AFD4AB|nr:hypothetical protein [Nostoc sp. 'Peltigera membranacea cyanobiont' N6]